MKIDVSKIKLKSSVFCNEKAQFMFVEKYKIVILFQILLTIFFCISTIKL